MLQVIPRKMAICVHQYCLCTMMKNVVYTDNHHDFFVENVDVFENSAGDSDFNLALISLANKKSTKIN